MSFYIQFSKLINEDNIKSMENDAERMLILLSFLIGGTANVLFIQTKQNDRKSLFNRGFNVSNYAVNKLFCFLVRSCWIFDHWQLHIYVVYYLNGFLLMGKTKHH